MRIYPPKSLTNRAIAVIILVVMLTQNVFIEGSGISPIKVSLMALMPLVFIIKVPYITKALILGAVYLFIIFFSAIFHPETLRISTIGYLIMFVITFITLYNLIHRGAFSLSYFIKLLKWMILAYVICLLCQQILVLLGIHFMPIVNLSNQFFLAINKLPSLSLEPSHSARIVGALMYAYMQCNGFLQGTPFRFKQLFEQEHKWVTIGFLWLMLTMGSGTAFIVLGVLALYFINWRNTLIIGPIIAGLVYLGSQIGIEQLDRVYDTTEAALTFDAEVIVKTDHSASFRILPMINTITNLDLTKKEHWFGYGIDSGLNGRQQQMLMEITDYGFLAYICGLILVFSCSIRFWSIPTIMYFIGIGGGTANVAYGWGILMIFMCESYFYKHRNDSMIIYDEQIDTCHLHV